MLVNVPKVIAQSGCFAARPLASGENVYKTYADSFRSPDHLRGILEQAQAIIRDAVAIVGLFMARNQKNVGGRLCCRRYV